MELFYNTHKLSIDRYSKIEYNDICRLRSNNTIFGVVKMDQQKIDMFIMTNQKYFPAEKIMFLKEKLRTIDEEKFSLVSAIEFKDPTTLLLISLFLGTLGIDRFMVGDTGLGILKLLTAGCCGILTIIDWFTITKKAKEVNFNKVMTLI